VTRWLDAECAARGLSDASRNRYRSAVSRLYRWLGERGLCEANPVAGVATRTERVRRRILYLERDERDRLLLAGADLPDIIAAWLACYAGLRRRELARLPWSAVRWEAERLHVAETKGGRPRVVELAPALLAELQRLRPDRPRGRIVDWPAAEPRWKWRADLLLDRLRERAVAVGICPGRIGWHTWRHSYGTHLAQAGAPIEYICSQLGNTSTVAREHYLSFIPAAGATGWAARL
jgi:integrase